MFFSIFGLMVIFFGHFVFIYLVILFWSNDPVSTDFVEIRIFAEILSNCNFLIFVLL